MPALQDAMGDQYMGRRRMEIRPLPALLSSGFNHLEPAILSPAEVDGDDAAPGCYALSLQFVPVQFREFPPLQGTSLVEETTHDTNSARGAAC